MEMLSRIFGVLFGEWNSDSSVAFNLFAYAMVLTGLVTAVTLTVAVVCRVYSLLGKDK